MTKNITVITMSGRQLPIEFDDSVNLEKLEKEVNKLTGIYFVENALENVYDDDERNKIIEHYKTKGPGFLTKEGKFVESSEDIVDGSVLRLVVNK